jgi:hypothetical protein
VFAIPGKGGELTDHGFITEEAGLVDSLMAIWERYLGASSQPQLREVADAEKRKQRA